MLVVLSAIHHVSGLCEPILEEVSTNLSYVGKGWFIHNRQRLHKMNAKMWVEDQWTPKVQRLHDQSLMKAFSVIEGITQGKMDKANHCRMYMKCITIADLANEKGTTIPGSRMNGEWRAGSTLVWPRLPKPPSKYWEVFRWAI